MSFQKAKYKIRNMILCLRSKPVLVLKSLLLFLLPILLARASLIAQLVKNLSAMQETPVWFLGGEEPLERDRLPTPVFLGFPCGSAGKESACNAGDLGVIPGLGRSPGEEKSYPLQCSGLKNSMDCIVHVVTKSQTRLRLSLHIVIKLRFGCWSLKSR